MTAGFCLLLVNSCGVLKPKKNTESRSPLSINGGSVASNLGGIPAATPVSPKTLRDPAIEMASRVIETARSFLGVSYKYGGTTQRGMDCSGLLYVSFQAHDIPFPRSSYQMAEEGQKINLEKVIAGDLLFFRTTRRGGRINHVGLVVERTDAGIQFIHASTSNGVILSSLSDTFWSEAFVKAIRVF
ncbi:MAG: murein DD-endopeptidase MepS/murein LD-carboxypeptidase [Bacteroidota bacterium]|jgi:cell wall-associated NlpC family hydrolase